MSKHTPGPWALSKTSPKRIVAPWKDKKISCRKFVAATIALSVTDDDARLSVAARRAPFSGREPQSDAT